LFKPPTLTLTEPSFELRTSQAAAALVVTVVGEVDMATAPDLAQAIDAGTLHHSVRRVVVDLTDVSFLDSSALNTLVHGQRGLAQRQTEFRVVNPSDHAVRRVFEITQLAGPLSVVDSLDDALA